MDIYTRRTERENDYYVVMGNLAGRAVIEAVQQLQDLLNITVLK